MALDYTALFTQLGKLVKHYDLFKTDASDLATDLQEILDEFTADDQDAAIEGLASNYASFADQCAARRGTLASYALRRMQDRNTVLDEIGATSADAAEVLPKLFARMITDTATIKASSLSLGSVTAGGSNVGNGIVLTTKKLDGVTSPGIVSGVSCPANNRYKGLDSALTVPADTLSLICAGDSFQDRLTEGTEVFTWSGSVMSAQHGVDEEGAGAIGSVRGLHANSLLANLDFETFTNTNTPSSWTINTGTAGTHILSESTNKYHGSKGLRLKGDGSLAAVNISQAPRNIVANRGYFLSARIKADSSVSNGDLTIQFEGTGYSAGSTEKINIVAGSLPTSFTLSSFFVAMPASIPSDFKLVIKWTGTPTNNKNLYIDDIAFGPAAYGAGVGVAIVRGSTPFVRNDQFTFAIANTEGVFQRFFRRVFGVQLPSAGSPTISDSLAS